MPSISLPVAILGAGALGAGASLLGSSEQAGAAKDASDLNYRQYEEGRADLAPWRQAGTNALASISGELGLPGSEGYTSAFRTSPGYQFAYDQGMKGVNNAFAASGKLGSGARAKGIFDYGHGMADQDYGNWFARLQSAAGLGQTATGQGVQLGQNFANNQGNLFQDRAAATASGYTGVANAVNSGLNNYNSYLNSGAGNNAFASYNPNIGWTPGPQGFPG